MVQSNSADLLIVIGFFTNVKASAYINLLVGHGLAKYCTFCLVVYFPKRLKGADTD